MIQVCDPPRQRQVRRLSAEEFFTLVRCGGAGFYRPCSEVLRMLTAGEAWGTPGAALLVLPLTADTAAAAALRSWLGRRQLEGGCLLTPPVCTGEELPARLVETAAARADRLRHKGTAWAVVECTETAAALLPLYFRQGFGLRALRPLESLAPCFFAAHRLRARPHCAGVGAAGGQGTAGAAAGKGLCCTGQPPLRRQPCAGALSAERNGMT